MDMLETVRENKATIAVIGLGYVGMPLAVGFAKNGMSVIGFDINKERVEELKKGIDKTKEVEPEFFRGNYSINYTTDPNELKSADIYIITVPTPVDEYKVPDLKPIIKASETIGKNFGKDKIVVLESTVYPGVTEEIMVPIIERESKLKYLNDFCVGYSPERINPGDKEHNLANLVKVVSGSDKKTAETLKELYGKVAKSIFMAKDIKTAEAAKVIENIQRDINIALMNELAVLFDKLGISIWDVLEASETKWNFLKFTPGLVGGHCIPVDPYYLVHRAQKSNYHPEVITSGRKINDFIPQYIVNKSIRAMNDSGKLLKNSKCLVMGLTFKENVPDIRSSLSFEVIDKLFELGANVFAYEPLLPSEEISKKTRAKVIQNLEELKQFDLVIITVAHNQFKAMSAEQYAKMLNAGGIIFDVRNFLDRKTLEKSNITFLRL